MDDRDYQGRLDQTQQELALIQTRYGWLSYARLILFLLGVGMTWLVFHLGYETESIFVGAVLLLLFMYLIKVHADVADRRNYLQHLRDIILLELGIQDGRWLDLDDGARYQQPGHAYAFDLDIFGRSSLYQYINRCSTVVGQDLLANWMTHPPREVPEIEARQEAVEEMGKKLDWSLHLQALGKGSVETPSEVDQLLRWVNLPQRYHQRPVYRALMWGMPALFVGAVIGALLQWIPASFILLVFLTQLVIVGLNLGHTQQQQAQVGQKSRLLQKYADLLRAIEEEDVNATRLRELNAQLQHGRVRASEAIKQLGRISYYLDQRMNIAAGLLLNGILLWDVQCIFRLEKWQKRHREDLKTWIAVMAQMDAYLSLGRLAINHPDFCRPRLSTGPFVMDAKALGHPLLAASIRINNDLAMRQGEFLIVTGANMAGKSTFLRTVGVNLVLAMMGAPVCAQAYTCTPIALMTSVRATDSLADHESYFYAELKRLKLIIEQLRAQPTFVIVDEMLRGTNSRDKQTGSRKFIEHMIRLNGVGLVATHDLALGKLAETYPDRVRNKRFEVAIEHDQLHFDYKLMDGISQNLNATFLMEKMGIM